MIIATARPGRRNETVRSVRRWTEFLATAPKQTGRRFGPTPKHPPRTRPPAPMAYLDRLDIYARQLPPGAAGFTVRQERQLRRYSDQQAIAEGLVPREGIKQRATPKRGAK